MTCLRDDTLVPPRVGYAVGRSVGRAVTRNLIRRRFRAAMTELARAGQVPGGLYLLGAKPGVEQLSYQELAAGLTRLLPSVSGVAR
jgi:ribonuclease P protein component